jgi:hypothetical protein
VKDLAPQATWERSIQLFSVIVSAHGRQGSSEAVSLGEEEATQMIEENGAAE